MSTRQHITRSALAAVSLMLAGGVGLAACGSHGSSKTAKSAPSVSTAGLVWSGEHSFSGDGVSFEANYPLAPGQALPRTLNSDVVGPGAGICRPVGLDTTPNGTYFSVVAEICPTSEAATKLIASYVGPPYPMVRKDRVATTLGGGVLNGWVETGREAVNNLAALFGPHVAVAESEAYFTKTAAGYLVWGIWAGGPNETVVQRFLDSVHPGGSPATIS
jgi:hypothetical protein